MGPKTLIVRLFLKHNVRAVLDWHMAPGNFSRSFPPWVNMELAGEEGLSSHRRIMTYYQKIFGLNWKTIGHFDYARNGAYIKVRIQNRKFAECNLKMEFRDQNADSCELVEKIDYKLRHSWFFNRIRRFFMDKRFRRIFAHKHAVLVHDLEFLERTEKVVPQKILIAGSSGLIGSALLSFLQSLGHDVWQVKHRSLAPGAAKVIDVDFQGGIIDQSQFEGFDAIINLCGSPIARRWTKKAKEDVMLSRYDTTRRLASIISGLQKPPKTFLSASAVGFYGDCGKSLVDESGSKGKNSFLADVCLAWEGACALLKKQGIRVVNLRFGLVLSTRGGALKKLIPLFKWGLGGRLGDGLQYMSWISIEDAVGAIHHVLIHKEISGPINIVSPNPVTNKEFVSILSDCLHRPCCLPMPKFALKILKGQMANELLLSSSKIEPRLLIESGYRFRYPFLRPAIDNLIL